MGDQTGGRPKARVPANISVWAQVTTTRTVSANVVPLGPPVRHEAASNRDAYARLPN